jgi:CubicO group peptidase (beta-lactamase class C family)
MRLGPALTLAILLLPQAPAQAPGQPSRELAAIAAAHAAKVAASAVFVSGRTIESVLDDEFAPVRPLETLLRPLLRFEVDTAAGIVTCRVGQARASAVHTPGLGCTLAVDGTTVAALRARTGLEPAAPAPDAAGIDWPRGDRLRAPTSDVFDADALAAALDQAFAEPPTGRYRTRAVVVVHRGKLVAERYAADCHPAMPLPGWSMTKALTHALLGAAVQQGRLDPEAPLEVPEWPVDDPRRAIRLDHLLTMTAGLSWREDYADPASPAARMLFGSRDHASAYAVQPATAAPGAQFTYSSGATNLLCRVLRRAFADDAAYRAFPSDALFRPLGMRSAVLELDGSGTFVGSSYAFASARDWARLGMLYAGGGEFAGQRILPRAWVAAALVPSEASAGRHGRHVWTNRGPDPAWPQLPKNAFRFAGYEGQYCFVLPDEELVVVRLGCTKGTTFPMADLVAAILRARR